MKPICPLCEVQFKNWTSMGSHVLLDHHCTSICDRKTNSRFECLGCTPDRYRFDFVWEFGQHLMLMAKDNQLKEHLISAMWEKAFGVR